MRKLVWILFATLGFGTLASGCVIDNTYASCFDGADCDVGDDCYQVTVTDTSGSLVSDGNFCSYGCSTDASCESNFGFVGRCYSLPPDLTQLCYQSCDFDADCYLSSVCVEVTRTDGFVDFICLPDN
jgi:hypothetical protein